MSGQRTMSGTGTAPDETSEDLVALVVARMCHDLANPLGAIANGIELLGMGGVDPAGPELALVSESVAQTTARLRFFRLAYGAGMPDQALTASEARGLLDACYRGTRLTIDWQVSDPRPRAEARVAFLLIQCAESAMPRGGRITVSCADEAWRVEVTADRIAVDPALCALLDGGAPGRDLKAAQVHFALAPLAARAIGRRIAVETGEGRLAFGF
jgi:histidine phosphotransferase ChpT